MQVFVKQMIDLKCNGLPVLIDGQEIICKGILLGGTLNLQAKAQVVDMSPHNGEFGCLTCEERREVTPQGKGYARVYPSRVNKPPTRTTEGVLENGLAALKRGKPIKVSLLCMV